MKPRQNAMMAFLMRIPKQANHHTVNDFFMVVIEGLADPLPRLRLNPTRARKGYSVQVSKKLRRFKKYKPRIFRR